MSPKLRKSLEWALDAEQRAIAALNFAAMCQQGVAYDYTRDDPSPGAFHAARVALGRADEARKAADDATRRAEKIQRFLEAQKESSDV